MRCKKAHRLLSPYLDAELPAGERHALETHLRECGACWKEYAELREVKELFSSAERYPAPFGMAARVAARARASAETSGKKTERGIPWGTLLLPRLAGGLVALAIIGAGILSGSILAHSLPPLNAKGIAFSLSLDFFEAAPPESLGGAYLAMTGERTQ
ncbi:MAG: zf-HC2 domain-containing protein [Alphaproteobacteria bacterium]|uniref:Zf-HC2 domain-containing protein n=1 Tax=Candidatus Nitrobium versatile TaxID=2884831 RepID=A0A953M2U8_9BACT|nr:zf-HC2 domain-containing protein [Candidatus Nitrobium versatile]